MHIPFLGELPLDPQVRIGGDSGKPVAMEEGDSKRAADFLDLAKRVQERAAEVSARKGPTIQISD
jgi:ATP-binding protein involved in chromosome partitioning